MDNLEGMLHNPHGHQLLSTDADTYKVSEDVAKQNSTKEEDIDNNSVPLNANKPTADKYTASSTDAKVSLGENQETENVTKPSDIGIDATEGECALKKSDVDDFSTLPTDTSEPTGNTNAIAHNDDDKKPVCTNAVNDSSVQHGEQKDSKSIKTPVSNIIDQEPSKNHEEKMKKVEEHPSSNDGLSKNNGEMVKKLVERRVETRGGKKDSSSVTVGVRQTTRTERPVARRAAGGVSSTRAKKAKVQPPTASDKGKSNDGVFGAFRNFMRGLF